MLKAVAVAITVTRFVEDFYCYGAMEPFFLALNLRMVATGHSFTVEDSLIWPSLREMFHETTQTSGVASLDHQLISTTPAVVSSPDNSGATPRRSSFRKSPHDSFSCDWSAPVGTGYACVVYRP